MELFFDVDGVILDFESALMDFIREHYLPDLPVGYTPKSWELNEEFKTLDIEKVWRDFVATTLFRELDLLIDADSFNRLASKYPVYFVTNLPTAQYSSRKSNLDRYNLIYKDLLLAGHFNFGIDGYPLKSTVISECRTPGKRLIFLDDHPENCKDVKQRFPKSEVYLMSRPHNMGINNTDWTRVADWNGFLKCIGE